MHAIHHRPRAFVRNLNRDVERLLRVPGGNRSRFLPALDIFEETTRYVVEADLPGVDPTAIDVTVDGDLLTIRGERNAAGPSEDAAALRSERSSGPFERVFRLPHAAAGDGIEASYRHGVLALVIPKAREAIPYRIEVTAN